eukprot:1044977-Prorocentrum_minimum.AAC.2
MKSIDLRVSDCDKEFPISRTNQRNAIDELRGGAPSALSSARTPAASASMRLRGWRPMASTRLV